MFKIFEFLSFDIRICFEFRYSVFEFIKIYRLDNFEATTALMNRR